MDNSSNKPIVLYFTPSIECDKCGRRANIGYIDAFVQGLQVGCEEHGFIDITPSGKQPTAYELMELHKSITRFVVWKKDGFGTATVISTIPLDSVPGYTEQSERDYFDSDEEYSRWADMKPLAYLVRYEDEDADIKTELYAVWSYVWHCFTLYGESEVVQHHE